MKSTDLKILFIDITKTAGTAIIESFKHQYPDFEFEGKHHSIPNFIAYGSCIQDDAGKPHEGTCSAITPADLLEYSTFSVIRNPYDRMVSLWVWGCNTFYKTSFDQFVENVAAGK